MENIINFEALEKPITTIEEALKEYNLEEQQLILKYVNQRIMAKIQKQMVQENTQHALEGLSIKSLFKKFKDAGIPKD